MEQRTPPPANCIHETVNAVYPGSARPGQEVRRLHAGVALGTGAGVALLGAYQQVWEVAAVGAVIVLGSQLIYIASRGLDARSLIKLVREAGRAFNGGGS